MFATVWGLTAQVNLPEDTTDRFARDLIEFAGIDSQVNNDQGIAQGAQYLQDRLETLGLEEIDWRSEERALTAIRPVDDPKLVVLFVAHFDTRLAPYEMPLRPRILKPSDPRSIEAAEYGPVVQAAGASDDKAGSLFSLLMIENLLRSDWAENIEIRAFFGADEEIGFKKAIPRLREISEGADIALNYEPGGFDRKSRRAFIPRNVYGNLHLHALLTGRASHAFIAPEEGVDAIGGFASHIERLRARLASFESPILINVSHLKSAERLNVLTDRVSYRAGIRFSDPKAQDFIERVLKELEHDAAQEDLRFRYQTQLKWPTHEISSPELIGVLQNTAESLGQQPPSVIQSPARSYGSMIAGWGVPSLEAMGPYGFHYHSSKEIVWVGSVPERAQLNCALIYRLANQ